MPITRKQFELGINSAIEQWMKVMHNFLIEHKDEAFTERELAIRLDAIPRLPPPPPGLPPLPPVPTDFSKALERLAEWNVAEARRVKGEVYYSYGPEPLDRFLG